MISVIFFKVFFSSKEIIKVRKGQQCYHLDSDAIPQLHQEVSELSKLSRSICFVVFSYLQLSMTSKLFGTNKLWGNVSRQRQGHW